MPASGSTGRVKGAAIREFLGWYVRTHGPASIERVILTLPPDQQALFDLGRARLGVLASDWFSADVVHAILDGLTRGLDPRAYDELAQAAADATLKGLMTGVQRVIFSKLMTLTVYSRIANLAFRMNYDSGTVLNEVVGPKRHRGHVEGWAAHHPFLCRMNVGMKAGIYTVMGCEGVRIEERYCRSEGQAGCGSLIAWG